MPDGTRGPDGQLVHDDFILADALMARPDELDRSLRFGRSIIRAKDPLDEMARTKRRRFLTRPSS